MFPLLQLRPAPVFLRSSPGSWGHPAWSLPPISPNGGSPICTLGFVCFAFCAAPSDAQGQLLLCTKELLLAMFGGLCGMPGITPR